MVINIEQIQVIKDWITEGYEKQISNLTNELGEQKNENQKLRQELETVKEQLAKQEASRPVSSDSSVNLEEFQALKKEMALLRDLFANFKSAPEEVQYDLRKEFSDEILFSESKLKLDLESKSITPKVLEIVLKEPLKDQKKKPVTGFEFYKFGARAIDTVLTIREWIIPGATREVDIRNFKVSNSMIVNNSFEPWNPAEKQVSLGTGTGKSTFFVRCLAHWCAALLDGKIENPKDNLEKIKEILDEIKRKAEELKEKKGGVTVVVPFSSLKGSILSAHNKWLSQGKDVMKNEAGEIVDDPDKRVTVCQICGGKHTADLDDKGKPISPYETKGLKEINETGPDCLINVFTWWEFLDVYLNHPEWIKPWVVFDEAHNDLPAYRSLMEGLLKKVPRDKRPNNFGIVRMSATFSDMPTSKKLTGNITDYYVNDFTKFLKAQPNFFNKKVIIFCDDFKKINFKELDSNKIKYIKLDDSLKDYATDIVHATSAPVLVFANRDYSVGFSFGNVNVISTGISFRKKITGIKGSKDKKAWEEETVPGTSDFADLLQERGRAARDKKHNAVWVSLIPDNGKYNVKDDYVGTTIENYFKKPTDELEEKLTEIISIAGQEKKPEPLPKELGRYYACLLFRIRLREVLVNPHKVLFNVLPSEKKAKNKEDEKYLRGYGEWIFQSPLAEYLEEEDLHLLIEWVIRDIIDEFARIGKYEWYETKDDQEDDYIFTSFDDAKLFASYFNYLQNYKIIKDKTHPKNVGKEIRIWFPKYKQQGQEKALAVPV